MIAVRSCFSIDDDFDVISELESFVLSVNPRAGGMTRDILAFESYQRSGFADLSVLVIRDCFGLDLQCIASLNLHVAIQLNLTRLRIVNRTAGSDLVGLVPCIRKDLKIDVFQFVMTVRESYVPRRAQPQIQAITFGDPLFIAVDDPGDFL